MHRCLVDFSISQSAESTCKRKIVKLVIKRRFRPIPSFFFSFLPRFPRQFPALRKTVIREVREAITIITDSTCTPYRKKKEEKKRSRCGLSQASPTKIKAVNTVNPRDPQAFLSYKSEWNSYVIFCSWWHTL